MNFRNVYAIKANDIEFETETTFIYSNQSPLIPRTIKYNVKLHFYEKTYDLAQITVRLENLDDNLREFFIERLRQFNLVKDIVEKPNNMFEMFQILAQKVKIYYS